MLRAGADRIDVMDGDFVFRLRFGSSGDGFNLSPQGTLLASTGDFTYVRYSLDQSVTSSGSFDDRAFNLGVIDSANAGLNFAWNGDVPRLMPTAGSVAGGMVYVGGRLHYHDDATFLGVVALQGGARTGTVVGCSPTTLATGREWAVVFSTTADDSGVYALVDRTDVDPPQYAIVRFPKP
jgi:hypothetical protein